MARKKTVEEKKAAKAVYWQKYYLKHRETILARHIENDRKDRAHFAAIRKKHAKKNRQIISERRKAKYRADCGRGVEPRKQVLNPETTKIRRARYYANNKQKFKVSGAIFHAFGSKAVSQELKDIVVLNLELKKEFKNATQR